MGDNIDHLLPQDEELVRRENIFLGMFDKYSIDEGDDAQLADLELSDEIDEADENASGSSFSETSSVEGDEANGSSAAIDEFAEKLEPAIRKRVNAWPEKGINLQLKRADPSLSVEEWLKANQESTTTTKKYKKTVVNEEKKTTTTTTKHTKTTTKRASFNTFQIPKMIGLKEMHRKPSVPEIENCWNDNAVTHSKSKDNKNGGKPKDQQTTVTDSVPVSIELSKLPMNKSKLTKLKQPDKKQLKKPIEPPIDASFNDKSKYSKPKQSTNKRQQQSQEHKAEPKATQIQSKCKNKISASAALPPVDENRRCLRSSSKRVCNETTVDKPQKKMKPTTSKKTMAKGNKQHHQIDSTSIESEATTIVPDKKKTESVHRSRSPLKDRQTNRRETVAKLCKVQINLTRLPCPKVTTRRSARMQNALLEKASEGSNDTTANCKLPSQHVPAIEISDFTTQTSTKSSPRVQPRCRPRKNELRLSSHQFPAIENSNATAKELTVRPLRGRPRASLMRNPPQQRPKIVIHSPSHETLLGTKIDDTSMLVTKYDYKKHINPKHVQKTNIFNRSIVPINRRIIYQPPIHDITAGDTDNDSECEDVLLSSYWNTGRFEQVNVTS